MELTRDWRIEDIHHGIEIRGLYEGIAAWVLNDGRVINRWAGVPGCENRAAEVQDWLDNNRAELMKEWN